jgi:hypothetical protein
MRQFPIVVVIPLFVAFALRATAAADEPATRPDQPATAPSVSDEQFHAALIAAGQIPNLEKPNALSTFNQLIRSVAMKFAEARVSTEPGSPNWQVFELNKFGAAIDAVRFHTPADGTRELHWAFILGDDRLDSWYIVRADGEMQGFDNYFEYEPQTVVGVHVPGDAQFIAQDLPAARLVPDKDYILWFRFNGDRPAKTTIAVSLVTPPPAASEAPAILKTLGITITRNRRPSVPDSPQ